MLDVTRLIAQTIVEEPLDPTVTPSESGLAYVRHADANGNACLMPSTGTTTATEVFVGVAILDKLAAASGLRWQMTAVVPASGPYTVTLPDSTGITNLTVYASDGVTLYATTTDYTVAGNVLTFVVGHAGATVKICYNYTLSATQLQFLGVSPIPSAASFIGSIAVAKGLTNAWVNNFDASKVYAINDVIRLGAGGTFGKTASATAIGVCIGIPTAVSPWLGIEYNSGVAALN
jgi:hypothetical protein